MYQEKSLEVDNQWNFIEYSKVFHPYRVISVLGVNMKGFKGKEANHLRIEPWEVKIEKKKKEKENLYSEWNIE